MKVREFAHYLLNLKPELQEKEIKVRATNNLLVEPRIKSKLRDGYDSSNSSSENVESVIIDFE